VLAFIALAIIGWTVTTAIRRYQRGRYRRDGSALLKNLWENYARSGDGAQFAQELVALMRRCAIAGAPQRVANGIATATLLSALQALDSKQVLNVISLPELSATLYDPDAPPLAKDQAWALYSCAQRWVAKGAPLPC